MNPILYIILALVCGFAIGYLFANRKSAKLSDELSRAAERNSSLSSEIAELKEEQQKTEAKLEDERSKFLEVSSQKAEIAERSSMQSKEIEELRRINAEKDRLLGELQGQIKDLSSLKAELQTTIEKDRESFESRLKEIDDARVKLSDAFEALSNQALDRSNKSFLELAKETFKAVTVEAKGDLEQRKQAVENLVKPIKDSLEEYQKRINNIESSRKQDYGSITEQLKALSEMEKSLSKETTNLVTALKAPQVRGAWGEHTLQRVIEMAGLVEYCDFTTQESVHTADGTLRPDVIVRLPGDRIMVIDAKNIFKTYYEAVECGDEVKREGLMHAHVKQVRNRIKDLSSKAYWERYAKAADFVLFFMPNENLYIEAMKRDENLFEEAMNQKILLVHPVTLVGILRVVALTWSQKKLTKNTEEIQKLGQELYERIYKVAEHFSKVGSNLDATVKSFNKAVGTLENRVLATARKFDKLGISGKEQVGEISSLDTSPRQLSASEFFKEIEGEGEKGEE